MMALCAGALVLQTYRFKQLPISNINLPLFVCFATLLSYNVHFSLAAKKSLYNPQLLWFRKKQRFTAFLNAAALLLVVLTSLQLKNLTGWIAAAIIFNGAYTLPLLLKRPMRLPLCITLFKSHLIGFTWAFVTVLLPLAMEQKWNPVEDGWLFVNRMLLVTIATLLFDYRDRISDREIGLRTAANSMHEKKFDRLVVLHTGMYLISIAGLIWAHQELLHHLQAVTAVFLMALYDRSKKTTGPYFYLGLVDGMLLFSAILSGILLF